MSKKAIRWPVGLFLAVTTGVLGRLAAREFRLRDWTSFWIFGGEALLWAVMLVVWYRRMFPRCRHERETLLAPCGDRHLVLVITGVRPPVTVFGQTWKVCCRGCGRVRLASAEELAAGGTEGPASPEATPGQGGPE